MCGVRLEKRVVRVELDPGSFKPCEVIRVAKGLLRRKILFVHFDGAKWRVLLVRSDGSIESYTLT